MAQRQASSLLLILLTACASTTHYVPREVPPPDYTPDTRWYELDDVKPDTGGTCPIPVHKGAFQRAIQLLARDVRWDAPPREAARELLEAGLEEEWTAEVSRGRVLTLLPLRDNGLLAPKEAEAVKNEYAGWCQARGGGDCLELNSDGPYLRADDQRTQRPECAHPQPSRHHHGQHRSHSSGERLRKAPNDAPP
ncbi:hypothetical protein F0U62_29460 [Cystobacter fuscus]|uniref:hypothetical protein n=1 Tax=Cystobacter fuscus TaxID=43 RepID=UPI002B2C46BE|nr:hypothetical protein F0U62_29460 [Cystobacter fuscus]